MTVVYITKAVPQRRVRRHDREERLPQINDESDDMTDEMFIYIIGGAIIIAAAIAIFLVWKFGHIIPGYLPIAPLYPSNNLSSEGIHPASGSKAT